MKLKIINNTIVFILNSLHIVQNTYIIITSSKIDRIQCVYHLNQHIGIRGHNPIQCKVFDIIILNIILFLISNASNGSNYCNVCFNLQHKIDEEIIYVINLL